MNFLKFIFFTIKIDAALFLLDETPFLTYIYNLKT